MSKLSSLFVGVLALAMVIGITMPASAQATNWTVISPDYGTSVDTPAISGCVVSKTAKKITVKVKAVRPTMVAESVTTVWSTRSDFSGTGDSIRADRWSSNVAIAKVTMPVGATTVISWQTRNMGIAITSPKPMPVLVSCS